MSTQVEYAYVTGGASGIGADVARMLASKGINVFIADKDAVGAEAVAKEIGGAFGVLDVTDWNDQVEVFQQALAWAGTIQYVYAIAGTSEVSWLPAIPDGEDFVKPNLTSIDVNLYGLVYTCALAIQQGRRQRPGKYGFKMKISVAGSVCGMYCCSTLPTYTAAKHGVTGFVRSFGKDMPSEKMTLNAVMPNVTGTNMLTKEWRDKLEGLGLLTPIEGVVAAFESLLGENTESGQCLEVGPNYADGQGFVRPKFVEPVDDRSRRVLDELEEVCRQLHLPH